MKAKKPKSLVGPVGAAAVLFVIGCVTVLLGLAIDRNLVILAGGALIAGGGGLGILVGEKMTDEFVRFQGGGAAKRARKDDERKSDSTSSDLTVPEEWQDPRSTGDDPIPKDGSPPP